MLTQVKPKTKTAEKEKQRQKGPGSEQAAEGSRDEEGREQQNKAESAVTNPSLWMLTQNQFRKSIYHKDCFLSYKRCAKHMK